MLRSFLNELEKRLPIEPLLVRFSNLFGRDCANQLKISNAAFLDLLSFIENGEASYQSVAVQAAVKWSASTQRVVLRNTIVKRGFLTPSCLWAYRQLRGSPDELFTEYPSPEMSFMQILLLKETDPAHAVPFLMEHFLTRRGVPEELRAASRLCVLRLLDGAASPELVRNLKGRYPGMEILNQWRPGIPGSYAEFNSVPKPGVIDFHQLVRSVHDIKELSSLTRVVYLLSLFYVPLTEKEWRSLLLSLTDLIFFQRLKLAGIVEHQDGGLLLSTEAAKQTMVKTFLYESYPVAKESVNRHCTERLREERERRVRNSELDRQALEMVPDGIICVDRTGLLYYMNPAAESILDENRHLRERLFGSQSLEEALRRYCRDGVLSRIAASMRDDPDSTAIFGDRIAITSGAKRFEVELGQQVVLIRDTTDQFLIDQEIGKLYRHELKAALDVMGVGIDSAKELLKQSRGEQALEVLEQAEKKRGELLTMLEERMDFIRLHSDAFQIHATLVNLNLVVDRCVNNYREAALTRGIKIRSNHLHALAVMVRGEERYLVRALDNIVRNAVKFSQKDSEISVLVGTETMEAFVRVHDSGPGIPPENLGKIFQLGFTTGGTGRGLYLARRIAAAHGGTIEVKSNPGSGATFALRLPLAPEV